MSRSTRLPLNQTAPSQEEPSPFARGVVYGLAFGLIGWALLIGAGLLLYHLVR